MIRRAALAILLLTIGDARAQDGPTPTLRNGATSLLLPASAEPGPPPSSEPGPGVVAASAPSVPKVAPSSKPVPTSDERVLYALGLWGRLLLVPGWMFAPWLQEYTSLTSGAVGLEFTRRKGTLDVTLAVDASFYTLPNGNFLAHDRDPMLDTHYVSFSGLNHISAEVNFMWHKDIAPWLEVMLGAGLGLGALLGDVKMINANSAGCKTDPGDPTKCFATSTDTYKNAQGQTVTIGEIKPGDPEFQRKLDGTTESQAACNRANTSGTLDCRDTALHPHYRTVAEKPPVMVVISVLVGLRFKVHRHFNLNLTGGFRNGWVIGAGPEYVF